MFCHCRSVIYHAVICGLSIKPSGPATSRLSGDFGRATINQGTDLGARGYIVYMVWYMVCVAKLNKRCDNKQMIQIDTQTDGDSWDGKTL